MIPCPDVGRKTREKRERSKDETGINSEYAIKRFGVVSGVVNSSLFSFVVI